MTFSTHKTLLCAALLVGSGQMAHADACSALAIFFKDVGKATKAEVKPATVKAQMTELMRSDKTCVAAVARLSDDQFYTHEVGAPLTALQRYLSDDARFAVRIIGGGEKVEAIEFDVEQVAVLRRRPTR